MFFVCCNLQAFKRFFRLQNRKARRSFAHDAGFLARDFGEGVTEIFAMIVREARDDRCCRFFDHIGSIEPATHANLENANIGGMLGKGGECRGSRHFEIAHLPGRG